MKDCIGQEIELGDYCIVSVGEKVLRVGQAIKFTPSGNLTLQMFHYSPNSGVSLSHKKNTYPMNLYRLEKPPKNIEEFVKSNK